MRPIPRSLHRLLSPRAAALALAAALIAAVAAPAAGQDLASFEKRTTVHTLANGWTFILVKRAEAPVFSFATIADVGGAQEVPGITGLAHMFEHMAFKGTPRIGTTDWAAEKEALAALETAYQAWQDERLSHHPDPEELTALEAAFRERQEAAGRYVVPNEFDEILEQNGAVGVNAFTSSDLTGYFYSLPANKTELFAYLESERFLHPVFREFYKERDVVQEERRLRTDSSPIGRLVEQFTVTAFQAHPYGQPVVGYMSDLQSITVTDAKKFFDTYYVPSNLVTAVVGDVDAETLIPLIEKYFGRIPKRPEPPALRTVEPPQTAEKVVLLEDPAQPIYLEGYHKPAITDPDEEVYAAIDDVLTNGRTSRLYRSLVRDLRLAVQVSSFSGFPGDKYPNLWAVFVVPAPGVSNEQIQQSVHTEIVRLASDGVTDAELERFKTRAKADLIRQLDSNQGLALQLADYQRLYGDWRELFRALDRIDAVTSDDVRRVAGETLKPTNRTVAQIVHRLEEAAAPADAAEDTGAAEEGTP
jgi:predicted Zn-dependent peptidase